jgi:hypothetical protein
MLVEVPPSVARLIAILLLMAGAADYLCFDVADPYAPMSAARAHSGVTPVRGIGHQPRQGAGSDALPDDCCLCCGTFIPARVFEVSFLAAGSPFHARHILHESRAPIDSPHPPPRLCLA